MRNLNKCTLLGVALSLIGCAMSQSYTTKSEVVQAKKTCYKSYKDGFKLSKVDFCDQLIQSSTYLNDPSAKCKTKISDKTMKKAFKKAKKAGLKQLKTAFKTLKTECKTWVKAAMKTVKSNQVPTDPTRAIPADAATAEANLFEVGGISTNSTSGSTDVTAGTIATLSASDQTAAITKINALRQSIASGSVSGQPAATKMNRLVWNDNVATVAGNLLAACKWEHSVSSTWANGYAGENLYITTATSSAQANIEGAMQSWFNEQTDFTYSSNACTSGEVCGHYEYMMMDDFEYFGCAVVECPSLDNPSLSAAFTDGPSTSVACGLGPQEGWSFTSSNEKIYETGSACSNCAANSGVCAGGLCDL